MPFDAGTAQGELTLDTSGFVTALNNAQKSLGGFISSAGKLAGGAALAGIAAAAAAATAGIYGLVKALQAGSAEAAEDERALVGLTNVLRASGIPNFEAVAESANNLATALQRTTGIADTTILSVVQRLAQLGVSSRSLETATRTVLDFSAAMGIDASQAALLFARSLDGTAGRLTRFLPGIKNLTKAQLEAGGAFKLAAEATKGQADALGDTFIGRIERLRSSFQDLLAQFGGAFNKAFGPLATEIQGIIDNLTDRLASPENAQKISDFFTRAAEAVKSFVLTVIQQIPSAVQAFAGIGQALIAIADGALAAKQFLAFGEEDAKIQKLRDNLAGVSDKLQLISDKANGVKGGLDDTIDPSKTLAQNVESIAEAFGLASVNADKTANSTRRVDTAVTKAKNGAQALVDLWKKTNEAAEQTAGSAGEITSETREAALAASDLADGFTVAADAADSAAASASAMAASTSLSARFLAQGADAFGRRQGGRTTLDFSDPFAAQAQATQAFGQLGRTGQNAYFGAALINSARQFADGVRNAAQASFDRAFAEFTAQILQELNSAGVIDPTERTRILRERIAEAQRFGILPATREVQVY